MANSTSDNLKLTVQATGENSGTWGQITNTNLLILEQAIGGYSAVAVNATTGATLTFSNGALSDGKNQVIKLTGTITGNVDVVVPDSVEKTYVIENGTTGAFTVTVKTTSGTGVTWGTTDKGTKMVYSDGTNVVDTAFTDLSSDITPQLSGNLDTNGNNILVDDTKGILDDSSNEQLIFSKTASAVNNIQIKNAATSSAPEISAIGDDTNIDLTITPKGSGNVVLDGLKYPNADGTCGQVLTTDGSGNITFADAGGGAVSWNTTPITADPANAVAGTGYFANTTGGAFTVTLPTSPSAGDIVAIKDYAGTFVDNNLTVARNGSNIDGVAQDATLNENNLAVTFIYVDGTQGWKAINSDAGTYGPGYIVAEGGEVTICGDYKIHTFNGPGIFSVSSAGNPSGSTQVDYMVIGGGGAGGGQSQAGGAGAGGFRESHSAPVSGCYTASPLATPTGITVSAQNYPIVIGAGGVGGAIQAVGYIGSPSSALGITSAGGGGGGSGGQSGGPGASGGGGGENGGGGSGNQPPVSPPQGNNGGPSGTPSGAGGGGAGGTGSPSGSQNGGNGGVGVSTEILGVSQSFAGGGGGGGYSPAGSGGDGTSGGGDGGDYNNAFRVGFPGAANTGGGGGGNGWPVTNAGGFGGSGKVVIRYKYR